MTVKISKCHTCGKMDFNPSDGVVPFTRCPSCGGVNVSQTRETIPAADVQHFTVETEYYKEISRGDWTL